MLRVSEVMVRLKISKEKIYRMIKNGTLPHVEFEGTIRVPEELLQEMIEKQLIRWKGKNNTEVENNITTFPGDGAEKEDGQSA